MLKLKGDFRYYTNEMPKLMLLLERLLIIIELYIHSYHEL